MVLRIGQILLYTWTQVPVPVSLYGANTITPTFVAPTITNTTSILSFSLTVTDSIGQVSAPSRTFVTVTSPVANAVYKYLNQRLILSSPFELVIRLPLPIGSSYSTRQNLERKHHKCNLNIVRIYCLKKSYRALRRKSIHTPILLFQLVCAGLYEGR